MCLAPPLDGRELPPADRCLPLALGDKAKRIWALEPQNTFLKPGINQYTAHAYNPSPQGGRDRRLPGLVGSQTNLSASFRETEERAITDLWPPCAHTHGHSVIHGGEAGGWETEREERQTRYMHKY